MPRPRRPGPSFLDEDETYENAIHYEGIPEAQTRVSDWIKKFHSGAKSMENEGEMDIDLFHYIQGGMGGEEPFASVEFDYALQPEQIAAHVLDAATEFLEGHETGKVRFRAQIEGMKGKVIFTLTVPERGLNDDPDEAPTMKGLVAQQMRHNQMLVKTVVSAVSQVAPAHQQVNMMYQKICEEKDKRITLLESGYMNNIKQMEDLANMRHLRDLDVEKMRNEERNKERVAGVLMNGIPPIINKILTGGAGPRIPFINEARSPLENQFEAFLETLKEDQFNALVSSGILTQEQLLNVVELVQFMRARQQAEREAAEQQAAAQNGHMNGQNGQNGQPGGPPPGYDQGPPQGPPPGAPPGGPPPGWGPGNGQ